MHAHALTPEEKGVFDAALRSSVTVVTPAKVSSPELASLAAKYVNLSYDDIYDGALPDGSSQDVDVAFLKRLTDDIRSLAASVLSQAEQRTDPNGAIKP